MTATALAVPAAGQRELVQRASRGDTIAFEHLVSVAAERSFRIARAILGNDSDAHDATQDAFVAAWRELPRLRDPDQFNAWVRAIVVNACRAQLRGRRRVREIALDPAVDYRDREPSVPDQVGDMDLLSRAFDRLDVDRRTLLVLHYLDHQPVASIAATLGVPEGTVKWRLSDARAALQRALTAEGETRR